MVFLTRFCSILLVLGFSSTCVLSQKLYVSENGAADRIQRINTDGSGFLQAVGSVGFAGDVEDLAIDPERNRAYWIDNATQTIQVADAISAGGLVLFSNEEVYASLGGTSALVSLAIDLQNRKLYWTNTGDEFISRADLDVSLPVTPENIITSTGTIYGIAVDPVNNRLFYTKIVDATNVEIIRTTLAGASPTTIVTESDGTAISITDIAIDAINQKIYYGLGFYGAGDIVGNIYQNDTDGSADNPVVTLAEGIIVSGLAVDAVGGSIYWAQDGLGAASDLVGRADLDGTNQAPVIPGGNLDNPRFVALDLSTFAPPKVYWTEGEPTFNQGEIHRTNLDGSDFERYYDGFSGRVSGIDIHETDGFVYWSDANRADIKRGMIGETGFQGPVDVIININEGGSPDALEDISLDEAAGFIYFSHGQRDAGPANVISKADLNAPDIQASIADIIITVDNQVPLGIDLDLVNNQIYYVTNETVGPDNFARLWRAELTGANPEMLYELTTTAPEVFFRDVKMDQVNQRVYWTAAPDDNVSVMYYNDYNDAPPFASPSSFLIAGGEARGIDIDPVNAKIYWVCRGITSTFPPHIMRSNLDGTVFETIHQIDIIPPEAEFIALDLRSAVALEPEINVYQGSDNTGIALTNGQLADVDFGSEVQGTDITLTFAIENTGTSDLSVEDIMLGGPEFSVTPFLGIISPGATETFTVQLSGANTGPFNDVITIISDDVDEGSFTFPVTGTITLITEPEISLFVGPDNTGAAITNNQVTAISFGSEVLGTDINQQFTIENVGSAVLNITSVTVGPGPFSIIITAPATINPGGLENFTVQLSGATIGTFNSSIIIQNDDGDEATFEFPISGSITLAPEPEIGVFAGPDITGVQLTDGQATSFSVGSTPGGTDLDQIFTIENTGSADLIITDITTSGGAFAIQGGIPPPLAVGATDNFTVRMDGSNPGTFSATINIQNNDADEADFDFPVSGTVLDPEIEIFIGADNTGTLITDGQLTPIDFGTEVQGTDIDQIFTIENVGTSDLVISSIDLGTTEYSLMNITPFTVGAGTTANFTIRLSGPNVGTFNDNVAVNSNDRDEPTFGFPITGIIEAPAIVIRNGSDTSSPVVVNGQPDAVDVGQTPQGTNIEKDFVIENTGSVDLNIISISTDLPSVFSIVNAPTIIAPGSFEVFIIRLNALTPGVYSANVTISSDAGDITFPVSGEVLLLAEDTPINVFNAVTPNGDGRHDYLRIENIEAYPGNEFTLYTKVGKKIFEITDYANSDSENRFEGYSNVGDRKLLAAGTYYYVINYKTSGGDSKSISGFILMGL